MIYEMKLEYQRQFGNDNFVVLILPGFGNTIIPYLTEYKIHYLDYSGLIPEFWSGDYIFPEDNHPNEKTYRIIAERLASELKTKF
jgi:lysophospholipase L1-like esterase